MGVDPKFVGSKASGKERPRPGRMDRHDDEAVPGVGQGDPVEGRAMDFCKVWVEQCEAARRIEGDFGVRQALDYLVGEKFLDFLEADEVHADFRAEVPSFVAEIKAIFEPWQLAEYLETTRQGEPFDPDIYEAQSPESAEDERREDIRRSARDLLLVERAREWLLGDG